MQLQQTQELRDPRLGQFVQVGESGAVNVTMLQRRRHLLRKRELRDDGGRAYLLAAQAFLGLAQVEDDPDHNSPTTSS